MLINPTIGPGGPAWPGGPVKPCSPCKKADTKEVIHHLYSGFSITTVVPRLPEGQGCLLDPADRASQGVPEGPPAPSFPRNPPNQERPESRRSVRPSEVVTARGGFLCVSPSLLSTLPFLPFLVSPSDPETRLKKRAIIFSLNLSHGCSDAHVHKRTKSQTSRRNLVLLEH